MHPIITAYLEFQTCAYEHDISWMTLSRLRKWYQELTSLPPCVR